MIVCTSAAFAAQMQWLKCHGLHSQFRGSLEHGSAKVVMTSTAAASSSRGAVIDTRILGKGVRPFCNSLEANLLRPFKLFWMSYVGAVSASSAIT